MSSYFVNIIKTAAKNDNVRPKGFFQSKYFRPGDMVLPGLVGAFGGGALGFLLAGTKGLLPGALIGGLGLAALKGAGQYGSYNKAKKKYEEKYTIGNAAATTGSKQAIKRSVDGFNKAMLHTVTHPWQTAYNIGRNMGNMIIKAPYNIGRNIGEGTRVIGQAIFGGGKQASWDMLLKKAEQINNINVETNQAETEVKVII